MPPKGSRRVEVLGLIQHALAAAAASPDDDAHHNALPPPSSPPQQGQSIQPPPPQRGRRGRPRIRPLPDQSDVPRPSSHRQNEAVQRRSRPAQHKEATEAESSLSTESPRISASSTPAFSGAAPLVAHASPPPHSTVVPRGGRAGAASASAVRTVVPMRGGGPQAPTDTLPPPPPPPPSLLGCLAACFGWRLASCSATEGGEVQFNLRHLADASLRATVRAPRDAFDYSAAEAAGLASVPLVMLNETAMPLADCPFYLQRLSEHLLSVEIDLHQSRLPTSQRALSVISETSPLVQPPPTLSLEEVALAKKRRAKKRARGRSPSPPSRHPVSHASTPSSTVSVAPRADDEDDDDDNDGGEEREGVVGPDDVPSPPSSVLSFIDAAAPVKAEAASSLSAMVPLTPSSDLKPQNAEEDQSSDDETLASLYLKMSSGEVEEPKAPKAPPSPDSASSVATSAAQENNSLSLSRSRRLQLTPLQAPTSAVATAVMPTAATTVAPSDTIQPVKRHSPPSLVFPSSLHHSMAKASFYLPYMASVGTSGGFPAAATLGGGGVGFSKPGATTLEGCESGANGGLLSRTACYGMDGWSACSSRSWLAHTHAVSRSFEAPPTSRTHDTLAVDERRDANIQIRGERQSRNNASMAEAVRATLLQRWLRRSSLCSQMEDSLRLSVGSGQLRGDALEAGVQALQASEAEQAQYGGTTSRDTQREGPLCTFPALPPRPMLPVSGKTVVEAQHRISAAEEAEATGEHRIDHAVSPRYTVCAGGIPPADRLLIDRTYSTRGSYVVAAVAAPSRPVSPIGGDSVKVEEDDAQMRGPSAAVPRPAVPALLVNPHEDLHYHIYKRLLPKDMRESLDAEGTLVIGPDGIGPVDRTSRGDLLPVANGSADEENDDDDEEQEKKVRGRRGAAAKAEQVSVNNTLAVGGAEPASAADIDYILRYRPAIRRIPMPDMESRYSL